MPSSPPLSNPRFCSPVTDSIIGVVQDSISTASYSIVASEDLLDEGHGVGIDRFKRRDSESVDTSTRKRSVSRKGGKERLMRRHDGTLKNKKENYEIDSVIVISDSDSETSVHIVSDGARGHSSPESFFVRDTSIREKKSSRKVRPVHGINRSKRGIGHEQRKTKGIKGSAMASTGGICSIVRKHLRRLMFPTDSMLITKHNIRPTRIPWKRLGIWLYSNKKRFINWSRSVSFLINGAMANNPSELLRKLLMVDLVDWSKEEINVETVDVPLILDPKGRPLAKVGDLPRMYPGYKYENGYKRPAWFDYEDDEDTDSQDKISSASDYYDSLVNSYGEKDSESQGSKSDSTLD